jgi:hypothetical protein
MSNPSLFSLDAQFETTSLRNCFRYFNFFFLFKFYDCELGSNAIEKDGKPLNGAGSAMEGGDEEGKATGAEDDDDDDDEAKAALLVLSAPGELGSCETVWVIGVSEMGFEV